MKAKITRLSREEIAKRLRAFEAKHGISSDEFARKYFRGEMGDNEEWFDWIALWRMNGATEQRSA
jgi:hypothetical protein